MSDAHTFIIIPFLLAFLLSVKRFYFRDAAASIFRFSFVLAFSSIALALCYLILAALREVPPYGAVGFGIIGVICFGLAIWQASQL